MFDGVSRPSWRTFVCDVQVPRFMSKTCLLDYDSIAGADKFGNIFVLRVPTDVSDDVDNPTGAHLGDIEAL